MSLGFLSARLLGSLLASEGEILAGEVTIRSSKIILPDPLISLGIPKYYQNESQFSGVYSRENPLSRYPLIKEIEDGHMSWGLFQNSEKVLD